MYLSYYIFSGFLLSPVSQFEWLDSCKTVFAVSNKMHKPSKRRLPFRYFTLTVTATYSLDRFNDNEEEIFVINLKSKSFQ